MKINYLIKTSLVSTGKFGEKFACTLRSSFEYNTVCERCPAEIGLFVKLVELRKLVSGKLNGKMCAVILRRSFNP